MTVPAPDHIAETAPLTDPSSLRDAQFEHRAQRIAADLWDERRDLEPHEQQFLTLVREIGCDYVRVCGDAKRAFGPDSKTALAVEFTARQRRQERYAGALVKYEADCG